MLTSAAAALLCTLAGGTADVRPLPFFYDLYTFRGRNGATDVVASFAVPAGRLRAERVGGDVQYRFDVSLVLSDTVRRTVLRTDDSVFVRLARPMPSDHLLYTHLQVRAAPSRTTLQRVIMSDATTPGIGQLYGGPIPVHDYRGDRLMLSDIALGQPGARSGWRRGDVTLALLPTSQLPSSAFDVFYEIYNLPEGSPYTTELLIEATDDGGPADDDETADDSRVRLRFSSEAERSSRGTLPELRRVDTVLPPGSYRLTVTVIEERTGRSASRSRDFRVHDSGPGASMVRARPIRAGTG